MTWFAKLIRSGIRTLENGLLEYQTGIGEFEDEPCLILCVEVDADGTRWAHVVRLSQGERVLVSQVTHYTGSLPSGTNGN